MANTLTFYMDQHVPQAVTDGLRRRGIDVVTAQDMGMERATDAEHLAFALRQGRVIFTQDADFLRLHAAGVAHSGIAYAPQQTPVGTLVRGLMLLYELLDAADMMQQLEFL